MNHAALKKEIESVDWSAYAGPAYYDPNVVSSALISLLELEDASQANSVGDRVLRTIGNNHAGTYYPAVLAALDIIIRIEKYTVSNVCRTCAAATLNDLYYFEPDVEGYGDITAEELKTFVQEKLKPYSDV